MKEKHLSCVCLRFGCVFKNNKKCTVLPFCAIFHVFSKWKYIYAEKNYYVPPKNCDHCGVKLEQSSGFIYLFIYLFANGSVFYEDKLLYHFPLRDINFSVTFVIKMKGFLLIYQQQFLLGQLSMKSPFCGFFCGQDNMCDTKLNWSCTAFFLSYPFLFSCFTLS